MLTLRRRIFVLLILFFFSQVLSKAPIHSCTVRDLFSIPYEYYQAGDIIIGGLTSHITNSFDEEDFREHPSIHHLLSLIVVPKNYQHLLALVFAVQEINENPEILPNVTLGFHIYDSYYNERMTYRATLELLSTHKQFVPNYECDIQKRLLAIIGGLDFKTSLHMATILSTYKIPQLGYGSFASDMQSTSFYKMVPNETHQYTGIVELIVHFGWTWVGFLAMDSGSEETFLQSMQVLLSPRGICFAFSEKTPGYTYTASYHDMLSRWVQIYKIIMESKANVTVVFGDSKSMISLRLLVLMGEAEYLANAPLGKVWIMNAQMDFIEMVFGNDWDIQAFHGSISFTVHSNDVRGFQTFIQLRNPLKVNEDGFLKQFWEQIFSCVFPNSSMKEVADEACTGEEKLDSLPTSAFEMSMTSHSYSVYNAVYVMAHALHAMYLSRWKRRVSVEEKRLVLQKQQPWQLHHFLKSVSFNNNAGETLSFDENMELSTRFDITNLVTFPNNSFQRVRVGEMNLQALPGKKISIDGDKIVWHRQLKQVGHDFIKIYRICRKVEINLSPRHDNTPGRYG
ncbi:hypothetical protein JD844_001758 [Phrynosoma platyrhinos]|uniref:Receptor ligand binding region domain-containing protein n=1 Tax=Phrynosoma platyrhinos TaxID=52577 RepID=A0ABQ7TAH2_PHRPL|nr:hypothetical protein JD844_001758 [Phrynosoma platyrhinos]